jgi:hypothetical protein
MFRWHVTTFPPAAGGLLRCFDPSVKLPLTVHGDEYYLPASGRFHRLYPVIVIHAVAEAALKDMEQQGIVSRSTSCLVLSLHMV